MEIVVCFPDTTEIRQQGRIIVSHGVVVGDDLGVLAVGDCDVLALATGEVFTTLVGFGLIRVFPLVVAVVFWERSVASLAVGAVALFGNEGIAGIAVVRKCFAHKDSMQDRNP